MDKLKIKVITGYRDDQQYTIGADEAHKAYYLFLNPEARTVFSNGVALIGKNIQGIEPDYHATMGWNKSHELGGDDWNEINFSGLGAKMQKLLTVARNVAQFAVSDTSLLSQPLQQAKEVLPPNNTMRSLIGGLTDKFKI